MAHGGYSVGIIGYSGLRSAGFVLIVCIGVSLQVNLFAGIVGIERVFPLVKEEHLGSGGLCISAEVIAFDDIVHDGRTSLESYVSRIEQQLHI